MKATRSGFTLIELMITVAIAAILATIAYPSYMNQIMRSNRSEARSALLQVQVAQEKFFLQNNRYAGAATSAASVAELNNSPSASTTPGLGIPTLTPNSKYTITLTRPSTTTYTVLATATTGQSQIGDTACRTFSITQTGQRAAQTSTSTDNSTECWR